MPYQSIDFHGIVGASDMTVANGGTHDIYRGAQAGSTGSAFINCVPGYLTSTTDPALSLNQIYFAFSSGLATNNKTFKLGKQTHGAFINSGGGDSTFVPLAVCLHFGSIFGADDQAKPTFFQGTGSMAADTVVRMQFDPEYFHSTGAFPPWNLAQKGKAFGGKIKSVAEIVGPSSQAYWAKPSWTPYHCGPLSPAVRGGVGGNKEIGPLTVFHAAHFFNQTPIDDFAVRAMAFASDFDGAGSVRDVFTNSYINVSNKTYLEMPAPTAAQQSAVMIVSNTTNGFTAPATPGGGTGFLWGGSQNTSHKPCMAAYAFMVFGEPHFHDLMIEASTASQLEMYAPNRKTIDPPGYGILFAVGNGLRSATWGFRDLMLGARFMAQNHPLKQYLNDLVDGNLAYCNALFDPKYLGPFLASKNSWRMFVNGAPSGGCGGFMMGYHGCNMGWLAAIDGGGPAKDWLKRQAVWRNYVLDNYGGYHFYAEYDGEGLLNLTGKMVAPIVREDQYGMVAAGIFKSLVWISGATRRFSVTMPQRGYMPTNGDRINIGHDQKVLPEGLAYDTAYYFVNVSGAFFDLSATKDGAPIPGSDSGVMTQGTTGAEGEGTPWIILANPPPASSGFTPTAAGSPESYLLYEHMAWNWAIADGVDDYTHPLADADTRLKVHFPDFSANPLWYGQSYFGPTPPTDSQPPATEITMTTTFSIRVGQTEQLNVAAVPADAELLSLTYRAVPSDAVTLAPNETGVLVTGVKAGNVQVFADASGVDANGNPTPLEAESDGTVSRPLATGLTLTPAS